MYEWGHSPDFLKPLVFPPPTVLCRPEGGPLVGPLIDLFLMPIPQLPPSTDARSPPSPRLVLLSKRCNTAHLKGEQPRSRSATAVAAGLNANVLPRFVDNAF